MGAGNVIRRQLEQAERDLIAREKVVDERNRQAGLYKVTKVTTATELADLFGGSVLKRNTNCG